MPQPQPQSKPSSGLSVPASPGMSLLLGDSSLCKAVFRNFPDFQKILLQIQLDITNETNRDDVGPTILALKQIHDILLLFKTKGAVIVSAEQKQQEQ